MRLKAMFMLMFAVAAMPIAAAAADPVAAPDPLIAARGYFGAGKFREAIAALDAYIKAQPANARAYTIRGDSKAELGDNEAALADYNTAIRLAPDYAYAYQTRCETRFAMNDAKGALADCNTAIKLEPDMARAYLDRGDVYYDQNAYADAVSDYDRAEKLGNATAYLFASRCDAKRYLNALASAAGDCSRALLLDPKNGTALWANGMLAIKTARYVDAVSSFNSYGLGDVGATNVTRSLLWRGVAYNRLGNTKGALADLNAYVAKYPESSRGLAERSFARYAGGDATGAIADLTQTVRFYGVHYDTADAALVAPLLAAMKAAKPLPPLPVSLGE